MISRFGWLSLDTSRLTVETLLLAAVLLWMYSSFLSDRGDWCVNK